LAEASTRAAIMARSKHDERFADVWARQCAQRERWHSNLTPDVPVAQPPRRLSSSPPILTPVPDERDIQAAVIKALALHPRVAGRTG